VILQYSDDEGWTLGRDIQTSGSWRHSQPTDHLSIPNRPGTMFWKHCFLKPKCPPQATGVHSLLHGWRFKDSPAGQERSSDDSMCPYFHGSMSLYAIDEHGPNQLRLQLHSSASGKPVSLFSAGVCVRLKRDCARTHVRWCQQRMYYIVYMSRLGYCRLENKR
jgi:hypothetical protein